MGPIISTRGIRQGDPLSPYLFIICAEGLSAMIRNYVNMQWLTGVKICRRAPVVSHMFFADDSYIHCKANTTEVVKVLQLLDVYERASGQQVNKSKSSVFFSLNIIQYNRQNICQVLQMGEADGNCKYLGLPSIVGRDKTTILGYLKEKVREKIRSWDGKCIGRSGKEVLIRAVVQVLPVYAMNVFLLPHDINKEIERCISKFWWQTNKKNDSYISWMSWDRMSRHKNAGGLSFSNFRDFNLAMLGKQGWRFITNPYSLTSRIFKAKYFPDSDFLSADLGHHPSFIWRSIIEAKKLLMDGIRWRIGDGESISIMNQSWLLDESNPYVTTMSPAIENKSVSSLFYIDRKEWDMDVIRDIL